MVGAVRRGELDVELSFSSISVDCTAPASNLEFIVLLICFSFGGMPVAVFAP